MIASGAGHRRNRRRRRGLAALAEERAAGAGGRDNHTPGRRAVARDARSDPTGSDPAGAGRSAAGGDASSAGGDPAARAAATAASTSTTTPPQTFRDCSNCPEMAVIPAGTFQMGAPPGENERFNVSVNEANSDQPQHQVTIAKPFALAKFDVTRAEFAAFAKATNFHARPGCQTFANGGWQPQPEANWDSPGFAQTDRDPVVCMNQIEIGAYIAWLKHVTGKNYRLPTEAEWEYAARGGTTTAYYWGNDPKDACAYENVGDKSFGEKYNVGTVIPCTDGFADTAPVGSFKPNPFGLYDMLGNVYVLTADCWNDTYAGAPSDGSAWTSGDCTKIAARKAAFGMTARLGIPRREPLSRKATSSSATAVASASRSACREDGQWRRLEVALLDGHNRSYAASCKVRGSSAIASLSLGVVSAPVENTISTALRSCRTRRAPVLPERFLVPPGFIWGEFPTDDGAVLRWGHLAARNPHAECVLVGGFGDFVEKQFETIRDLAARGLSVWCLDWRGQGGSTRPKRWPHRPRARRFERDAAELAAFAAAKLQSGDCRAC